LKISPNCLRGKVIISKEVSKVFLPITKFCSLSVDGRPHILFSTIQNRMPIMGISMRSRTSGFRKWSEAHDPKIPDARAVAGEAAVIPVPALDQPIMTPEEQPHRPWRVPGAGTL
jgi:hypothetical protein